MNLKIKTIVLILILGFATTSIGSDNELHTMEISEKTFEQRLGKILELTKVKYAASNKNFGIDFSDSNMVIFQLIKRTLLESAKGDEFGYGIHLSFDDSFPETKAELERFTNSEFAVNFHKHIWDDIPTYQLDLKTNDEQILNLTRKVIEVVYEKDVSEIDIGEFEI